MLHLYVMYFLFHIEHLEIIYVQTLLNTKKISSRRINCLQHGCTCMCLNLEESCDGSLHSDPADGCHVNVSASQTYSWGPDNV